MPIPGLAKTPIIYVGSVKNLRKKQSASATKPGVLWFEYTDDYSVFDYGKMPDRIPDKGAAAAMMTAVLFEQIASPATWRAFDAPATWAAIKDKSLRDELRNSPVLATWKKTGTPTHYQGILDGDGRAMTVAKLKSPSNVVQVSSVRIIHPEPAMISGRKLYNYGAFTPKLDNHLVPLECIFRFGVPRGSSLLKRLAKNPSYGEEIGLTKPVQEGDVLPRPIVEFSTKLEPADRMVPYDFAMNAAGMTGDEFRTLVHGTMLLALWLRGVFAHHGIKLWDGKFEFLRIGGRLVLGDAITADELRLTYRNLQISKEPLRQYHHRYHPTFVEAMEKAKKISERDDRPLAQIVETLGHPPKPVDPGVVAAVSDMYCGITEALVGKPVFGGRATLDQVAKKLKKYGIA